jgi:hypothetical protein
VIQAEQHRQTERAYRISADELRLPGYLTMAKHHHVLWGLVCDEIRQHCRQHGLELPESVPAGPTV